MPDGNAPSSLKLTPQQLLEHTERSLRRVRDNSERFSQVLGRLTKGIHEWAEQQRSSPMKQRVMDLNETSERYLRESRTLQEQSAQASRELSGQMETFARMTPAQQQELATQYAEKAAGLSDHIRIFEEASDHLGTFQRYLRTKADAADNYLQGAGEELRGFGNTATYAISGAQDLTAGVRVAVQQEIDLRELEEKLGAKKSSNKPISKAEILSEETENSKGDQTELNPQDEEESLPRAEVAQETAEASPSSDQQITESTPKEAPTEKKPIIVPPTIQQPVSSIQNSPDSSDEADALATPQDPTLSSRASKQVADALKDLRATGATPRTESTPPFELVNEPAHPPKVEEISVAEQQHINDALAELKKNRIDVNVADATRAAPSETKEPASAPPENVAIEAALQDIQQKTENPVPTTSSKTTVPPTQAQEVSISSTEQQTIDGARAELKEKYATRERDGKAWNLYQEQMRTRSWEYLQTHDPARYQQLQRTQQEVPDLALDASIFLTSSEQQTVHLRAVADVRAQFPDITDKGLSAILLKQSLIILDQAQSEEERMTAQLGTLAAGGFIASGGLLATTRQDAPKKSSSFAVLYQQARGTRDALQKEEHDFHERQHQLQTQQTGSGSAGTSTTTSVADQGGETLRQQQRQGLDTRRALQGALYSQLKGAQTAQELAQQLATEGNRTASQMQAMGALLETLEGRRPANMSRQTATNGARGQTSATIQAGTLPPVDRAAYEAGLAAKLVAQQLQDQRFAGMDSAPTTNTGGTESSGGFYGGSSDANDVIRAPQRSQTATQRFAAKQERMTATTNSLIGTGAVAAGYDAVFADANDRSPDSYLTETSTIEVDESDLEEIELDELESQRVSQLLEEQQHDRADQLQQQLGDALRNTQGKSGLNTQALQQGAKLLSNPYVLAVAIFLVFFWLNIRLLFPQEGSLIRKPLSGWGILGTLVLDAFVCFGLLISFTLLVVTAILPFIPVLLALGGVFATLQGVVHLLGG